MNILNSRVTEVLHGELDDSARKIYLDSFVYSHIAKDKSFAENVRRFITQEDFTLVCSGINFIEIYPNKKRWIDICEFIGSVSFAIAANPDEIAAQEVRSYPASVNLPVWFVSKDTEFTKAELSEAIQTNLESKIKSFQKRFQRESEKAFKELIKKRDSGTTAFTKPDELKLYLMTSVLSMLYPEHKGFLKKQISSGEAVEVEQFRTFHTQALAVFVDYYEQKKKGKPSDAADYLQLGYAPYVDLAVFDNERTDTVRRINKKEVSQPLNCVSLGEFHTMCELR